MLQWIGQKLDFKHHFKQQFQALVTLLIIEKNTILTFATTMLVLWLQSLSNLRLNKNPK